MTISRASGQPPQHLACHGARDAAAGAQSLAVEHIHDMACSCERTLNAQGQIFNNRDIDLQLPIMEELDQNSAHQRIIWFANFDSGGEAQA
jgi:hypothetical protein